jgi:hypothetical protein
VSRGGGESHSSAGRRSEPPLRPLDLLAALHRHEVEFVVIGGYSLAAHRYVRATKDLDVVPEPNRANLERLLAALEDLDAEPLAIGDFKAHEVPELNLENLERGGNWLLRTRYGRLDVMQYVEGMKSYAQLRAGAITRELPGFDRPPLFAGLDDLIALKQAAGRDQDLADIAELERRRQAERSSQG